VYAGTPGGEAVAGIARYAVGGKEGLHVEVRASARHVGTPGRDAVAGTARYAMGEKEGCGWEGRKTMRKGTIAATSVGAGSL